MILLAHSHQNKTVNNKNRTVLVLGAGGMLGHMAMRVLSANHRTFGTTRSNKDEQKKLTRFIRPEQWIENVDVRSASEIEKVIRQIRPDVIINCIGLVKQKMDSHSYIDSIEVNALLPHRLHKIAEHHGSKLIQISTDCVFTCNPGVKHQNDEPNARDLYGITKSLGEVNYGNSLTLRTSIVGRQIYGNESLFECILSQREKTIEGYRNAKYTGLTTNALCNVIDFLIRERMELTGIWQVSSEEISKFELVTGINRAFSLYIEVIENHDFFCDRRLDSEPFRRETGFRIPTWDEMIEHLIEDDKNYAQGTNAQ
jgi:dTDP-4-dehydrorhamnose reductase